MYEYDYTVLVPSMLATPLGAHWAACTRACCSISKFYASYYMRDMIHIPPISQRIDVRISVWVWRFQLVSASGYLRGALLPTSGLAARRNLRSASQGELEQWLD